MGRTIKSDIKDRGYTLKPNHRFATLPHGIKVDRINNIIRVPKGSPSLTKFDKDFEEGLKDLFENYDNTLKNLVNK